MGLGGCKIHIFADVLYGQPLMLFAYSGLTVKMEIRQNFHLFSFAVAYCDVFLAAPMKSV